MAFVLKPEQVFEGHEPHREWLIENTPYFDCPDADIKRTFKYRWSVYRDHIKRTPSGYVVTEFLPPVSWAGAFNTISCAAGHHYYEGRWIHDARVLDDYSEFWFGPHGEPRSYSFWVADAMRARSLVTGDSESPARLLDALVENYKAWEEERLDKNGLFWQLDDRDGMEHQIGGSGCRPSINSYMYGDAVAISAMALQAGRPDLADQFAAKAAHLKQLVLAKLWDSEARFFKTLPTTRALVEQDRHYGPTRDIAPQRAGQLANVKELLGFVPWAFHLPDAGYEEAWRTLFDPQGFKGRFGPSTAERAHPEWLATPAVSAHECQWRGASWPFATAQTLTAMANLLIDYSQREVIVTEQDYFDLLQTYARSHVMHSPIGDLPWIDESLHPDTGEWITREILHARNAADKDRGRQYNHSTFCDLVITGLVGLRPRGDNQIELRPLLPEGKWDYFCLDNLKYHNRFITVVYDLYGDRYGVGKGFGVFSNGRELAWSPTLNALKVELSAACEA